MNTEEQKAGRERATKRVRYHDVPVDANGRTVFIGVDRWDANVLRALRAYLDYVERDVMPEPK